VSSASAPALALPAAPALDVMPTITAWYEEMQRAYGEWRNLSQRLAWPPCFDLARPNPMWTPLLLAAAAQLFPPLSPAEQQPLMAWAKERAGPYTSWFYRALLGEWPAYLSSDKAALCVGSLSDSHPVVLALRALVLDVRCWREHVVKFLWLAKVPSARFVPFVLLFIALAGIAPVSSGRDDVCFCLALAVIYDKQHDDGASLPPDALQTMSYESAEPTMYLLGVPHTITADE
jgi:hypothetical protein